MFRQAGYQTIPPAANSPRVQIRNLVTDGVIGMGLSPAFCRIRFSLELPNCFELVGSRFESAKTCIWLRSSMRTDSCRTSTTRRFSQMSIGLTESDIRRYVSDAQKQRAELVRQAEFLASEIKDLDELLVRLSQQLSATAAINSPEMETHSAVFPRRQETLPSMIALVMEDDFAEAARGRRSPGLKPSEITSRILRVFGCEVPGKAVNSHLWYLLKKNRVSKTGNRYFISAIPERAISDPEVPAAARLVSANDSKIDAENLAPANSNPVAHDS